MTEKFDQTKEEAFKYYNDFIETLSDKDKIAITRFISSVVYAIQNNFRMIDPFEVISSFRINNIGWFEEIKNLFRQYNDVITYPTVNFTELTRILDLERFEEAKQFSIISVVSIQNKDTRTGGKIFYSSDSGVTMCVIPANNIYLSTFVVAHEIAHLTLAFLGVDALESTHSGSIAIEMLCDYFAIFVYHRLVHVSDKRQYENLSKTLKTIAYDEDTYALDELQIREIHLKSVLDELKLI